MAFLSVARGETRCDAALRTHIETGSTRDEGEIVFRQLAALQTCLFSEGPRYRSDLGVFCEKFRFRDTSPCAAFLTLRPPLFSPGEKQVFERKIIRRGCRQGRLPRASCVFQPTIVWGCFCLYQRWISRSQTRGDAHRHRIHWPCRFFEKRKIGKTPTMFCFGENVTASYTRS